MRKQAIQTARAMVKDLMKKRQMLRDEFDRIDHTGLHQYALIKELVQVNAEIEQLVKIIRHWERK